MYYVARGGNPKDLAYYKDAISVDTKNRLLVERQLIVSPIGGMGLGNIQERYQWKTNKWQLVDVKVTPYNFKLETSKGVRDQTLKETLKNHKVVVNEKNVDKLLMLSK
ncbi:hypothetical protein Amet_0274 [Alkaliphilus metalliredigens QYMF]|uniref:Uncharacterized protein n=1 Tax=Alkaliphilus metalliredigens (strain QYMF) TaxID=293826 RepID=A6TJY9_ALKMQ|nr:hypothetical protein [Alkaliphilus metalliredigens]ABR46507.1 hypothetical protein Amet_0274 [Alkaliphilus metalliredigens QYMF]